MKKIIAIIAAISATIILAACGETTQPTTEPVDDTIASEPIEPVIETEPIIEIEPIVATEPAQTQFQFGDIIWTIRRCTADEDASVTRCRVIAQSENFVVVAPMWGPDMDQFRENLTVIAELPYDDGPFVELILETHCYIDRFEAEAAIENGDV